MKRWSLFIISLVLIYICVGCGKTESDTENPSQQDPSQTDTDSENKGSTENEETNYELIAFGSKLTYDDAFSFSVAEGWDVEEEVRVSDHESYVNHGSPFFVIKGEFQNLYTEACYVDMLASVTFDDKWNYDGMVIAYDSGYNGIVPLQECTLKFAFEVPQSVIDSFEKCTLKLDYNTKPLPVSESETGRGFVLVNINTLSSPDNLSYSS